MVRFLKIIAFTWITAHAAGCKVLAGTIKNLLGRTHVHVVSETSFARVWSHVIKLKTHFTYGTLKWNSSFGDEKWVKRLRQRRIWSYKFSLILVLFFVFLFFSFFNFFKYRESVPNWAWTVPFNAAVGQQVRPTVSSDGYNSCSLAGILRGSVIQP